MLLICRSVFDAVPLMYRKEDPSVKRRKDEVVSSLPDALEWTDAAVRMHQMVSDPAKGEDSFIDAPFAAALDQLSAGQVNSTMYATLVSSAGALSVDASCATVCPAKSFVLCRGRHELHSRVQECTGIIDSFLTAQAADHDAASVYAPWG